MIEQRIVNRNVNSDYGIRGERTGKYAYKNGHGRKKVHEICVGDVVSYNDDMGNAFSAVVLKLDGSYGLMGRGITHLEFDNITITVPYKKVPIEMINALHESDFEYKKVEAVEMTIEEIEELVGKRVKIIKEER